MKYGMDIIVGFVYILILSINSRVAIAGQQQSKTSKNLVKLQELCLENWDKRILRFSNSLTLYSLMMMIIIRMMIGCDVDDACVKQSFKAGQLLGERCFQIYA